MAAKLSALLIGRTLLPRNVIFQLLVLIPVKGLVRQEGLGKLKKFTTSGLEPATFRLVA
jgi:hypothetical protein